MKGRTVRLKCTDPTKVGGWPVALVGCSEWLELGLEELLRALVDLPPCEVVLVVVVVVVVDFVDDHESGDRVLVGFRDVPVGDCDVVDKRK